MSNQEMQYAQEEQKWWQKTWFIVFMLLFFFPVGLFLMYRYTKYKTVAIGLAVCIVSYSVYAHFTRPATSPAPVSPASSTPENTTPATAPVTSNASSISNESAKSTSDVLADQQKIVRERKPIAISIQNKIASALGNVENLTVTVSNKEAFDASFDMDIPNNSVEAAKEAGVDAIQTVLEINPEYQFSLVSAVVTCKHAPIGIVIYSPDDDKYTFVAQGKRSEFTP